VPGVEQAAEDRRGVEAAGQNQSIPPSRATSAALWQSPTSA
jgi:hypothetical protein